MYGLFHKESGNIIVALNDELECITYVWKMVKSTMKYRKEEKMLCPTINPSNYFINKIMINFNLINNGNDFISQEKEITRKSDDNKIDCSTGKMW